jgi:hypothetical protein
MKKFHPKPQVVKQRGKPAAKQVSGKKVGKSTAAAVEEQDGDRPTAYSLYRQALEAPLVDSPNPGVSIRSPEICAALLAWLAKGYLPGVAAQKVGITRVTAYKWRKGDPEFAEAWDEAVQMGDDLLEQAIRNRAAEGYDRPVFQGGVCVGMERVYSDGLAAMMLQGRRRAIYGKNPDGNDKETTVVIKGGLPSGSTVTVHKGGDVGETAKDPPDQEEISE